MPDNPTSEQLREVAVAAAQKGGDIIERNFGEGVEHKLKKDRTLVTATDLAAEEAILSTIRGSFPNHTCFSEESGTHETDSEYEWVIDPLDGTSNFVHGLPHCCSSIGLRHKKSIILGVVYAPLLDELFVGVKGSGAWLNDSPLEVDTVGSLESGMASTSSTLSQDRRVRLIGAISAKARTIRILGSSALSLCYVADGRISGHASPDVNLHDGIAGGLIAHEAGAIVTDFRNDEWNPVLGGTDDIVAAPPRIHGELLEVLQDV